jgi:hypothetical protein
MSPMYSRFAFAVLIAFSQGAWAALGAPLASSAQDGTPAPAAYAARAAAVAPKLQSRALRAARGVFVTEYANSAGTVFAVAWRGRYRPDLGALLGSRYAAFSQTSEQAGSGVAESLRQGQDIVVRSSGHMGAFSGVAWAPSLLPAGVDPMELQP